MGCDIHLGVEKRVGDHWERVLPHRDMGSDWDKEYAKTDAWWNARTKYTWFGDRNYDLFGMLANVRNGHGFAGIQTGDGWEYLSDPRGLPIDLSEGLRKRIDPDYSEDDSDIWLGDHSFSWLTLAELQEFFKKHAEGGTKCFGVIPLSKFREWLDAKEYGPPSEYCGGVTGPDIVTLEASQCKTTEEFDAVIADAEHTIGRKVHIRISWYEGYLYAAGRFYSQIMPALAEVAEDANDVRIVFAFDS